VPAQGKQSGRASAPGQGWPEQTIRDGSARIWILTDQRYLKQRMPLAVLEWLEGRGCSVTLVVADEGSLVTRLSPAGASVWRGLAAGDVIVARSRHPFALALLREAEALGARTYEPWGTVMAVRDKATCALRLSRAGLPVPPTYLASSPGHLAQLPAHAFPLLLKPPEGDNAEGLVVVDDPRDLGALEWEYDLILAQPFLDAGGVDLKVYVAGRETWAVHRQSPLSGQNGQPVPARLTPALAELTAACGGVLGLRLFFGIDVVESNDGLFVVDVNEFPNYSGIEEAPAAIGRLLLAEAGVRAPGTNGRGAPG
jgi:ribosomal protein S6--L-glutamate ligase